MHKHYPPFYPIYCRFFQFLFSNVSVNSSRCFRLNLTLSSQSRHIDHESLSIYKRKHSLNRLLLHQNLKSSSILWGVIISYKPNIKPLGSHWIKKLFSQISHLWYHVKSLVFISSYRIISHVRIGTFTRRQVLGKFHVYSVKGECETVLSAYLFNST